MSPRCSIPLEHRNIASSATSRYSADGYGAPLLGPLNLTLLRTERARGLDGDVGDGSKSAADCGSVRGYAGTSGLRDDDWPVQVGARVLEASFLSRFYPLVLT
jgi:hypothetical protein